LARRAPFWDRADAEISTFPNRFPDGSGDHDRSDGGGYRANFESPGKIGHC